MTEQADLVKIRRALISVSDKTGIVEFARQLRTFKVEIISTGGTARHLRDAGIELRDVSDLTGFPEMMDGRVKTLHPRIHGGLLALRENPKHIAAMQDHGIEPIDMVVVNLYPFEQTVALEDVTLAEAVEQIDIGGPAMIRSAAKNWKDVTVVVAPAMYDLVAEEMRRHDAALTINTRAQLAKWAFADTSQYDTRIFSYLSEHLSPTPEIVNLQSVGPTLLRAMETFGTLTHELTGLLRTDEDDSDRESLFAPYHDLAMTRINDLRYGENPHQQASLYQLEERNGSAQSQQLSGKEMSYNNYLDTDAAWQLVCDFSEMTCAIIKHTNPAGVGQAATSEAAYRKALATDPVSAFGGIVALNCKLDAATAKAITEIFTEVVIAPDYDESALEILKTKKNLRVLQAGHPEALTGLEYRQISGGMLVQTRDTHRLSSSDLKIVTKRQPTEDEISALLFAWTVCKHTKSNAIVYARSGQTVGVGAGQMSRVDSVRLGAMRARLPLDGSVMASDAFFPFRDGMDEAARHGITAVIQPGGSVKDPEVIASADEHGLAMVFTGIRHFKH